MAKLSAALLLHRVHGPGKPLEVLIVHPGGPFWAKKDLGAWSLPKGEYEENESPLAVARREFEEEIGLPIPEGDVAELGTVKQPSGKVITAFSLRGDLDLAGFRSNSFEMEWPKGSGKLREFPEVDRAEWFTIAEARDRLLKGHVAFLDSLIEQLISQGEDVIEGGAGAETAMDQERLF